MQGDGQESQYRSLVEWIPAITYTELPHDVGGATLYISPQVEQFLGYPARQWIGDPELWQSKLHPDDRDRVVQECAISNATGEPFRTEYRIYTADGHVVWLRDESVLVRDPQGRPQYWQGLMMDITERRLAEAALEQSLQREREAAAGLQAMDRIKETFLEAVSHDLRTPLTVVLGTAITLKEGNGRLSGKDAEDLLEGLVTNARKLERLITNLLDVDSLRQGGMELTLEATDVAEMVRGIVRGFDPGPGHTVRFSGRSATLSLDRMKVERILENLLSNAVRHTPAGTRIDVAVEAVDGGVTISVDDDGPGIPERTRHQLFEPFQDRDGGNGPSPGMRIGLALVSRFARLHAGRAWVQDRPGGGSSFRVFLPAAEASGRRSFLRAPEEDALVGPGRPEAEDAVLPFRALGERRPLPPDAA